MFYDYKKCPEISNNNKHKKYFYVILFIKSFVYNVKGQAIIFRRKSIESLMKLIYDFDQTYLHTSLENSFDKKQCCKHQNVDFIVKYDDDIDNVLSLIDTNAYIIKLSWNNNIQPHPPCPPIPPVPPIPPYPPYPPIPPFPPHPPVPPVPPSPTDNLTHIRITNIGGTPNQNNQEEDTEIGTRNRILLNANNDANQEETTEQIDEQNQYLVTFRQVLSDGSLGEEQTVDLSHLYNDGEPIGFRIGDDCLYNSDKHYLIKLDPKNPYPDGKIINNAIHDLLQKIKNGDR